jgi:hypothetical protein
MERDVIDIEFGPVMEKWHAVTFRNAPNEFAFTHAVLVEHAISFGGEKLLPKKVLCEKELPETMQGDIAGFFMYIDKNWVSCDDCQRLARGAIR